MALELDNKSVLRTISELYLNTEIADISFVFEIDGQYQELSAHKFLLAAASPVFHRMFFGPLKQDRFLKITDTTIDGFREFLKFFYLTNMTLSTKYVAEVIHLANKYDMFECINTCTDFIRNNSTFENICCTYELAIQLNNQELKCFCETMITRSPLDFFQSSSFLHCDRNVLRHILQLDILQCKEINIFNACITWAKFACKRNNIDENIGKNLRIQLDDCFLLIRFNEMALEDFTKIISKHRDIFSLNELVYIEHSPSIRGRELMCWRESTTNGAPYHIKNIETVCFTTNKPILLTAFWCKGLLHRYSHQVSLNFKITISESNVVAVKTLFTAETTLIKRIKCRIGIVRPIVICSEKTYEIRMETENCDYHYHHAVWESEVSLDDDLIVNFYQNPLDSMSNRRGLVSCFSFRRI